MRQVKYPGLRRPTFQTGETQVSLDNREKDALTWIADLYLLLYLLALLT